MNLILKVKYRMQNSENSETQVWLDFALVFKYIDKTKYDELFSQSEEIGRLLNHMMQNPEKYRGNMQVKK